MDCENGKQCNPRTAVIAVIFVLSWAMLGAKACARHRRHRGERDGNCEACADGYARHMHGVGHGHGHHMGHDPDHHMGHGPDHGPGYGRGPDRGPQRQKFDPKRILDKRFASGEIDEDEYRRRRQVLEETA